MFTCRVNTLSDSSDFRRLFLVLIINLLVIYLLGIIFTFSNDSIETVANNIVLNRINTNIPTIIISSTITGFLCSVFVESENKLKSLNFRPCYIIAVLCTLVIVFANLPHCLIDLFLYSVSSETFDHFWSVLARLSLTILFNFLGCSLFNIIANKSFMHSHID
jgi:NADH:ubiquinone oxidoreductase subunit 2 (subunit N)